MWAANIFRQNLLKFGSTFLEQTNNHRNILWKVSCSSRFSDDIKQSKNSRNDMEELFLDQRVRYLLKALTGYDPMKVFASKSMDNLNSPKYRFMTDEQLKMEIENADQKADSMLQMPPVKYSEEFEPRVFEKDIALQGFLDPSVKLVFMDATSGFSDNERIIVVREADGTLREANREERHRTNQIFYPVEERQIDFPNMFEEPHLTEMFERAAYKLLLDNVCLHFEPEDPKYNELCQKAYDHIDSKSNFDYLWSTRHYGCMVFYYVFNKRADNLLYHLLSSQRINESYNLLCLYYIINPSDQVSAKMFDSDRQSQDSIAKIHQIESSREIPIDKLIDLLKIYIKNDSNSNVKSQLELLLQNLMIKSDCSNKNVAQN